MKKKREASGESEKIVKFPSYRVIPIFGDRDEQDILVRLDDLQELQERLRFYIDEIDLYFPLDE